MNYTSNNSTLVDIFLNVYPDFMSHSVTPESPPARRGRRPGRNITHTAILDAARRRFSANGYANTTIRSIAADAGVDPRLITQFFGTKDKLFAGIMSVSPEALDKVAEAYSGPVEALGEQVVRAILSVWEGDHPDAHALQAMWRSAISNERANEQLQAFIQSRLIETSSQLIGKDSRLRAGLAASMIIGVVVTRRVTEVPTLSEAETEEIVNLLSPAIQQVLQPQHATSTKEWGP